ncbi:MAG TPA: hypothetical protein VKE70_24880, partial [Candidatus Solibacter sp.]|nr:hypothetical protein [Candidatus Solibacter sp.]
NQTFFPINIANFEANPNVPIGPTEPDAVNGSFKTPGLRNVDLTGPYMHNGGEATLEDVIDFYNRGGNFFNDEKHPDITQLGLTAKEKAQLVVFLKTLTDDRVRYERAPFDHPQIWVPDGHPYNPDGSLMLGTNAKGRDVLCEIPAVGSSGGPALQTFVQLLNNVTTDSVYGALAHTLNNCVVQPAPSDLTPPSGQYKGLINGRYTISVSDTGSGLSSILVTTAINANVTVPEIVGQTAPVNVTYTKINSSQSSTVSLQATDVAGNVAIVDPWEVPVTRDDGTPTIVTDVCSPPDNDTPVNDQRYTCGTKGAPIAHPYEEHYVTVKNNAPGLTNLRLVVNGSKIQVAGLKDGETREIDIKPAMKGNSNTFGVEALGKPGGSASVVFHN